MMNYSPRRHASQIDKKTELEPYPPLLGNTALKVYPEPTTQGVLVF